MPVVDRRVERLPALKQAILDASSSEEALALQQEFETIGTEHRATFTEIQYLSAGWKYQHAPRCSRPSGGFTA